MNIVIYCDFAVIQGILNFEINGIFLSINKTPIISVTLSISASKFGSGLRDLFDMSFFLQVGHSLFLQKKIPKITQIGISYRMEKHLPSHKK